MTAEPTFDVAPLLEVARIRALAARTESHPGGPVSDNELGDVLGRAPSVIREWRTVGHRLLAHVADYDAAQRLNLHPAELWPDWFDHGDFLDCPHGWDSYYGYRKHKALGEEPCQGCRAEYRAFRTKECREQRRRRRAAA